LLCHRRAHAWFRRISEDSLALKAHICRRPRDVLTADEVARIHLATLQVLAEAGVVFEAERARRILERGGCRVDHASGCVTFPSRVVEECLAQCPSDFTIQGRDRRYDLEISPNRLYFQSHPGLYIRDLNTGQRRWAILADIGPLTRLIDALDQVHVSIVPSGTLADKAPEVMTEWVTAEQMRNTQKVVAAGVFHGCTKWIVEMARVTGQQVYGQMNPITPLHYPAEQTEGGLAYVAAGHPICILPGPTVGANSPATLAGTLVLQNVEHLAGVVLVQLTHPGAPVVLGGYPHVMDMRTGAICIGGVETGLLGAALAQIGRRYGVPTHAQFPVTDAKTLDEQAAIEKAMSIVLVAEANPALISNGGALETEKAWSPVQLVIDNEINAMVGRVVQGIAVTEETLAVDTIEEVGPGGHYLSTLHTLRTWQAEQYLPELADRLGYDAWEAEGCRTMVDRARERARDIVRTHQVPRLSNEQDRELDRILRAAEREKLG
jgi:trimethylamine--corrinoid protein Co-methyltransferase